MPRGEIASSAFGLAGIPAFIAAISRLGEGDLMGGGILLALTGMLATVGLFLSPFFRTKWKWASLSILSSVVLGCVLVYVGTRYKAEEALPTMPGPDRKPVAHAPFAISQISTGDESPNIVAGGPVTVNPPRDPNEPIVSYDPNGVKHTQIGAKFYAAPALVDVYNTIQSLYEQNRWRELAEASERQIENHPDWLTPYLYAGVAYANSGEEALAVKRLDYFRAHASERPDYAGWHQDAVRLLAALGATEP